MSLLRLRRLRRLRSVLRLLLGIRLRRVALSRTRRRSRPVRSRATLPGLRNLLLRLPRLLLRLMRLTLLGLARPLLSLGGSGSLRRLLLGLLLSLLGLLGLYCGELCVLHRIDVLRVHRVLVWVAPLLPHLAHLLLLLLQGDLLRYHVGLQPFR